MLAILDLLSPRKLQNQFINIHKITFSTFDLDFIKSINQTENWHLDSVESTYPSTWNNISPFIQFFDFIHQFHSFSHIDLVHIFLEKAMAPHSSTLDWKIPWAEEPGRLQSMGSQRVRHDWETSLSVFTLHWRKKWQPTPVFLPGESQGRGSLVGCRLLGRTESDTTEVT